MILYMTEVRMYQKPEDAGTETLCPNCKSWRAFPFQGIYYMCHNCGRLLDPGEVLHRKVGEVGQILFFPSSPAK